MNVLSSEYSSERCWFVINHLHQHLLRVASSRQRRYCTCNALVSPGGWRLNAAAAAAAGYLFSNGVLLSLGNDFISSPCCSQMGFVNKLHLCVMAFLTTVPTRVLGASFYRIGHCHCFHPSFWRMLLLAPGKLRQWWVVDCYRGRVHSNNRGPHPPLPKRL